MPLTQAETAMVQGALALLQGLIGGAPMVHAQAQAADDEDLDGKYGDPVVKFNPRDWHGSDCKGLNMSGCPPEFLDLLAGTFDYFAKKNDQAGNVTDSGKPKGDFDRREAARARGWAKRIRAGWKPAEAPALGGDAPSSFGGGFAQSSEFPPVDGTLDDSEIPF